MIRQCKEHGLPEPEFISVRNLEFKTILARDVFTETNLAQMGLNDRQVKAIKYIKEHRQITRKDYVSLVSISPRQALIDLTELVKKKVLILIGKGRSSKYTLRK
jgi:ATP-dependent DNA helicase RecG